MESSGLPSETDVASLTQFYVIVQQSMSIQGRDGAERMRVAQLLRRGAD